MRRPAEITTVAGAYAFLGLYLFDLVDDPVLLVAATIVVGHIPVVVSWIVNLVGVERRKRPR